MDILGEANAAYQETIAHRRYLHENAEVGFDVPKTTAYIIKVLQEYGYEPKILKKGGIIAEITAKDGGREGFILLRADIDGLKIEEKSGLPFACKSGNMHACGHDMHAASLLTAAKIISQNASRLACPVRLLFQPAEEILEGGRYAISRGVCKGVKEAFSLHVLSGAEIPCGKVVCSGYGVVAPSADVFEIRLFGKSCHGAAPHEGVDSLPAAVAIMEGLQTIVAREVPLGKGLVTVGQLSGGASANVLADTVLLRGTCRAFDEQTRLFIKRRIRQIVRGIALAYRVKPTIAFLGGCPSLWQDKGVGEDVKNGLERVLGKGAVLDFSQEKSQSGEAEDFAYISRTVPSFMVSVSAAQAGGGYPLHHPRLVFDEAALPICVAAYLSVALKTDGIKN